MPSLAIEKTRMLAASVSVGGGRPRNPRTDERASLASALNRANVLYGMLSATEPALVTLTDNLVVGPASLSEKCN
ncbi:hypothetical protein [Glaciimonas immobilis]|uniref:Uncharacterized protein n=1 Tax=Glaciimonas immobilis TaxID=728004 RepID=A0A840RTQ6_9BURK|nr:hypothetical protein [Glaciimonas immobilis]KAF3997117.1 hypothetical protein HAV38_15765 [Glaciimonas immobilis]MBB5199981.1 hypothetical protein [Glaciimonas immobilis]